MWFAAVILPSLLAVGVWQRIDRQGTATYVVGPTIVGGLFPRLAHLARWPTRLRGRRLLIYVAWNGVLIFAVRFLLVSRFRDEAPSGSTQRATCELNSDASLRQMR